MATISQLQEQAKSAKDRATDIHNRVMQAVTAEGRAIGPGERAAMQEAVSEAQSAKAALDSARDRVDQARSDSSFTAEFTRMTGGMVTGAGSGGYATTSRRRDVIPDIEKILASDAIQYAIKHVGNFPSGTWTSPSSEVMATTLTGDSASGGGLLITDTRPGILPLPQRPLTMSDLIAPGETDGSSVTYMKEVTFTNAADTVAEGAAKPESAMTFVAVNEPVRKIAHWIPVTEEMFADVPALGTYLAVRLRFGVQIGEDDQLLNGSVVAPDIVGFLARTGLATSIARGADTNADAILRQIAAIFVATGLQPTGIVMNPANWITIQLLKSAAGEYISGNSPFTAPQTPTLWGIPVALTSAMVANTALVGAFKTAAQLFRKGGLRVEISNSHSDFFTKNLIAIRAEERLALAVYRPSAFGTVTGLN